MLPGQLITPDMVCLDAQVQAVRELWLVMHEDVQARPEIRQVADWITQTVPPALTRQWRPCQCLAIEGGL